MVSLLSVQDLWKSFGALRASDGISLEVADGETHAVIGPNGAGKTTFISQLAGTLRPDGGRIAFAGEDITRLPGARAAASRAPSRSPASTSISRRCRTSPSPCWRNRAAPASGATRAASAP